MGVTVLLPVYNGAATLRQSIDSVLAQDVDDWELLVVDDASTDGSADIAHVYAARDPRIRVVAHAVNAGLAATLNEGLEEAGHELVARLDQDDEALPPRLRLQTAFMAEHPNVVAAGSHVLHMGVTTRFDRLIALPSTPREVARRLPRENCLYHPSVIMRREPVLAAGGYRSEFKNAEDYELWLRLARSHDLANVPEPLIRYRFSLGGMTLGRKWEQLFYVRLAQEMNRGEPITLAEAEVRARRALAAVDRRDFMRIVARGTTQELVALRLWRDARELLVRFSHEIGMPSTIALAAFVATSRIRR